MKKSLRHRIKKDVIVCIALGTLAYTAMCSQEVEITSQTRPHKVAAIKNNKEKTHVSVMAFKKVLEKNNIMNYSRLIRYLLMERG